MPATISEWLTDAVAKLKAAGIPSARLDAELLLAHVLGVERSSLIANNNEGLSSNHRGSGNELLKRRLNREPLAYITGKREFYGRSFLVNKRVLIPRPESEALIDVLREISDERPGRLIDVGTGSGVLAISAKSELPHYKVEGVDISEDTISTAETNAKELGAQAKFYKSDLLANVKGTFEIIVANLPYVDRMWERSPETAHEPSLALFAADHGMELIKKLITQSPPKLNPTGYLVLEADPRQHEDIVSFAQKYDYQPHESRGYIVVLQKI